MDYTLFGKQHLILLLISIIFIVFASILLTKLNKKNDKRIKITFIILYIIIFLSELSKQLHGLYEFGEINVGYYPFHICSYALYIFPFIAFSKKYPKTVLPITSIIGIVPGLITIFYPSNVLQGGFVTANSFFYHSLMVIFGILILTSGIYKYKPKDLLFTLIGLAFIFAVALIANTIFEGADFAFLGTGQSAPFGALFIENFGKFLYVITVFLLFSLVAFLFQLPMLLNYHKKSNKIA